MELYYNTNPNNIDLVEFCKYIQPILTGCAGFTKTDGYMVHLPGVLLFTSDDNCFFGIINLPVIFDIIIVAKSKVFLGCKEIEQQRELLQRIYFLGNNMVFDDIMRFYNIYKNTESLPLYYYEEDCYNIEGFAEHSKKSTFNIGWLKIIDNNQTMYRIPCSKYITPLTKADSCSIGIYAYANDPTDFYKRSVIYSIYKHKFKFAYNIYFNIMIV